jgi:hypothetical protein
MRLSKTKRALCLELYSGDAIAKAKEEPSYRFYALYDNYPGSCVAVGQSQWRDRRRIPPSSSTGTTIHNPLFDEM